MMLPPLGLSKTIFKFHEEKLAVNVFSFSPEFFFSVTDLVDFRFIGD